MEDNDDAEYKKGQGLLFDASDNPHNSSTDRGACATGLLESLNKVGAVGKGTWATENWCTWNEEWRMKKDLND